jgi:magnesium-transporting ATPase (P-type)
MTPRSLFNIVLKIFGLFFLKNIIETVPQLISTIAFMLNQNSFDPYEGIFVFLGTTLILAFYIFVTYELFFKTNVILDKLKLDKGFTQDQFSFELPKSSTLTVALIIIGGIILTNEIPNLCKALYQYIQQKTILRYTEKQPDLSYAVMTGAKIILGLLILGERKRIVEFIESKQKVKIDE